MRDIMQTRAEETVGPRLRKHRFAPVREGGISSMRGGDFQVDGERTSKHILDGKELILNSRGESVISYADYAIIHWSGPLY